MLTIFRASLALLLCTLLREVRANQVLLGGEFLNLERDSRINYQNRVLEQFDKSLRLELRPNLELKKYDLAQLTLRPRLEAAMGSSPRGHDYETLSKRDLWLNEGFVTINPRDEVQLTVGRQNYLWGPSEVVGPSNTFYSDLLNRPNPLFLLRGLNMARLNLSRTNEFSLVTMAELPNMKDADFQMRFPEEDQNQHRWLLKGEYASGDGEISAGLVIGQKSEPSYTRSFGSYFMWTVNSAFQAYFDARVDNRDESYLPYSVMGVRWTFLDGTEWRNEYIYKRVGPNLVSPLLQDNLIFDKYYYSGLRINLDSWKTFESPIWGIRSLYSLSNHSGTLSSYIETGINDMTTFTTYIAQTYGKAQTDYNQLFHTLAGAYLTLSF